MIKIHQYKAGKDGKWLDDAISIWSGLFNWGTPPYSHTEIQLSVCFAQQQPYSRQYYDKCFSSATRGDGFVGTRWADAAHILRHPERWDTYTFNESSHYLKACVERADEIAGQKYFYLGIALDYFLPLGWLGYFTGKGLKQWYCSQAIYYVLTGKRTRISPRRLTRWLLKNGFVKDA